MPPFNRGRFAPRFTLALDFILLPRSGKTQYRTAVKLLSSSLPLCENWRLCSCGCGAEPPPVPRGGARFRIKHLALQKEKAYVS